MAHERLRTATPLAPIPRSCLTYSLKRAGHAWPALSPGHVALKQIPLGQPPSVHRLLGLRLDLVRRLCSYYGAVRLPVPVHHRRASLDFPTRPVVLSPTDRHTISRFPLKVLAYMRRVSDRAESKSVSRYRHFSLAFRSFRQRRHPEVATASAVGFQFRGSMAGLYVPLSTLHLHPYERRCMTRGRCGSLLLHRMKLSFTTPCRFYRRTEIRNKLKSKRSQNRRKFKTLIRSIWFGIF